MNDYYETNGDVMVEHGVPGSLLRIIFKSVEEHLGEKGLRLLLTQAKMTEFLENPPPDIDTPVLETERLKNAIGVVINLFGEKAAKPLLLRWGKLSFDYAIEKKPALFGLAGFVTKFMGDEEKIRFILKKSLKEAESFYGAPHFLTETPDSFNVEIKNCFYCGNVKSDQCVCWVTIGFWKSMLKWATGKDYNVRETECMAMGAESCKYTIPKKAIE